MEASFSLEKYSITELLCCKIILTFERFSTWLQNNNLFTGVGNNKLHTMRRQTEQT